MITLAVILAVIVILALLRVGVSAEYSAEGISVVARAGFVSVWVFPAKDKWKTEMKKVKKEEKKAKKEEKKAKKDKKEKKKKKEPEVKAPGGIKGLLEKIPPIKNGLRRFRRRLLIKTLTLHYTSAGDDPSKTAITFGASNAVFAVIVPLLEKAFRIRRRDFRANVDFTAAEPVIYAKAAISIAVWEAVYVFFAILPLLTKSTKNIKETNVRKGGQKDGQTSDKRAHGNNDAESQGIDRRKHDSRRTDNDA